MLQQVLQRVPVLGENYQLAPAIRQLSELGPFKAIPQGRQL
jgi:hypothetical protein